MSLLAIAGAILIGLTLGLTGAGGSIITLPVLVYLAGFSPREAVPMSLLIVGAGALAGAVRRLRNGEICLSTAAIFGIFGMIGAVFGARLTPLVTPQVLMISFAVLMLAVAGLMLRPGQQEESETKNRPWALKVGAGLGVGLLTGFIGVGGGFLLVPALLKFGGLKMRQAVGSSLAIIFLNCVAGFLSHMGESVIRWDLAATYSALAVGGVFLGSHIAGRIATTRLRQGFAVMVIFTGAFVLYRNWAGF